MPYCGKAGGGAADELLGVFRDRIGVLAKPHSSGCPPFPPPPLEYSHVELNFNEELARVFANIPH